MKRNKLNFEEISQRMEVLDRDSQRGVKGGLSAAELLADIAANGIDKYVGKTYAFDGVGQNGISYLSNNISDDYINGFTSGFTAYGEQGGYGNPYQLAEVVVNATRGGGFNNSKTALDIGGTIFGALQKATLPGNLWIGLNGIYNDISWGGNQYTGSRSGAIMAGNNYRLAGNTTVFLTAGIGVIETIIGYQMDGGQIGYNAQSAALGTTGSLVGGWAGAEAGAWSIGLLGGAIGGPPGMAIGAVIGVVVGGMGGSHYGKQVGTDVVDLLHEQ